MLVHFDGRGTSQCGYRIGTAMAIVHSLAFHLLDPPGIREIPMKRTAHAKFILQTVNAHANPIVTKSTLETCGYWNMSAIVSARIIDDGY